MSKSHIETLAGFSRRSCLAWLVLALVLFVHLPASAESDEHGQKLDVKELIFEHLGDGYGWEVPFSHNYRIPLPVIVRAEDGRWISFSSAGLTRVVDHMDADGKVKKHAEAVIKTVDRNGKTYQFIIAHTSKHKDKVVQIFPLTPEQEKDVKDKLAAVSASDNGIAAPVLDGYVYHEGKYWREYRPLDLSITKNVCALFITVLLVLWMMFGLIRFYKRNGMKAPRRGLGFVEMLVGFVYFDTIKATLGDKTRKFAPYLLTVFFFILTMNLVGLIVIFPGGANLTGNIAVTLVLAVCTFIMTNIFGNKHYWKEIFWPDVPLFLKFPLPIMQLIEVFGIFTKPAALCVRLFANMMGGHMIVITLTLLIFILGAFGAAIAGMTTVISVLFSIFMLLIDVLVSFIQAYVFTLLSAIFIGMANVHEEEHKAHEDKNDPQLEAQDEKEIAAHKALMEKEAAAIDL